MCICNYIAKQSAILVTSKLGSGGQLVQALCDYFTIVVLMIIIYADRCHHPPHDYHHQSAGHALSLNKLVATT